MSEKENIDQEIQEENLENTSNEDSISEVEIETQEEDELSKVQKELSELKDTYARVHADFDNIKKRLEREKHQSLDYALEKFAKDLVPVVDSLTLALDSKNSDIADEDLLPKVFEGVELTMKQLLSTLEKHGVTQVSEDEEFDPNIHHAVQKVDSDDHESGQIVNTFQKGYKYKDRTLRDAMVVIAN